MKSTSTFHVAVARILSNVPARVPVRGPLLRPIM